MNVDEKKIVDRIKGKEIKVFEELFRTYYPQLAVFASHYVFDAEAGKDIVQEVFIHFWENAHKIEIKKSIKAYFYQSVRNKCCNHLRSQNVNDKHQLLYIESLMATHDPDLFSDPDLLDSLEKAIEALPYQMRKIMRLKYIEEKKIIEVSHLLHISDNTVKTQLLRGKQKLKELLTEMVNTNIFAQIF